MVFVNSMPAILRGSIIYGDVSPSGPVTNVNSILSKSNRTDRFEEHRDRQENLQFMNSGLVIQTVKYTIKICSSSLGEVKYVANNNAEYSLYVGSDAASSSKGKPLSYRRLFICSYITLFSFLRPASLSASAALRKSGKVINQHLTSARRKSCRASTSHLLIALAIQQKGSLQEQR